MGCDIHLFVERRNPETGTWENVDPKGKAPQDQYDKESGHWDWYGGRNYSLFAILADVRNGYGFAGADTGDGFKPISKPRGIPEDASWEYRGYADRWEGNAHSHSYFTVKELLDYDWTQTTTRRGVIGALQFFKMTHIDKTGHPDSWSGGVFGQTIRNVSLEEMNDYVKTTLFMEFVEDQLKVVKERRPDDLESAAEYQLILDKARKSHDPSLDYSFEEGCSYFTQVGWRESYANCVSFFLGKTLPALQELDDDPENVRIVFLFDN